MIKWCGATAAVRVHWRSCASGSSCLPLLPAEPGEHWPSPFMRAAESAHRRHLGTSGSDRGPPSAGAWAAFARQVAWFRPFGLILLHPLCEPVELRAAAYELIGDANSTGTRPCLKCGLRRPPQPDIDPARRLRDVRPLGRRAAGVPVELRAAVLGRRRTMGSGLGQHDLDFRSCAWLTRGNLSLSAAEACTLSPARPDSTGSPIRPPGPAIPPALCIAKRYDIPSGPRNSWTNSRRVRTRRNRRRCDRLG